jgi:hypothetical protein
LKVDWLVSLENFLGKIKREYLILNAFISFEPVTRFDNRRDTSETFFCVW